jgi:hypothetical protein
VTRTSRCRDTPRGGPRHDPRIRGKVPETGRGFHEFPQWTRPLIAAIDWTLVQFVQGAPGAGHDDISKHPVTSWEVCFNRGVIQADTGIRGVLPRDLGLQPPRQSGPPVAAPLRPEGRPPVTARREG